jgi:DNA-binding transcriptional regulator/RsmH inhibitor MraZ
VKYSVTERDIDPQGRVLLPKGWRAEIKTKKVILLQTPEYVKILPKRKVDLTKYSNSIKVDLKAPLTDWHAVEKELLGKSLERFK